MRLGYRSLDAALHPCVILNLGREGKKTVPQTESAWPAGALAPIPLPATAW